MSFDSMRSNEVIRNMTFYPAPVEKVLLSLAQDHNIVLTGPRGGGKSVVLHSYEKKQKGEDEIAVGVRADLSTHENLSDDKLSKHYELLLTEALRNYVSANYGWNQQIKFKRLNQALEEAKEQLVMAMHCKYIRLDATNNILVNDFLTTYINAIKEHLDVKRVTLFVDRFDWLGDSSYRAQKLMHEQLEKADRFIITSDDNNLLNDKKDMLEQNNVSAVVVNYGQDEQVAKEIVDRDFRYWQQEKYPRLLLPENMLSENAYHELIQKCNGNFNLLFATLKNSYESVFWLTKGINKIPDKQVSASFVYAKRFQDNKMPRNTELHL